MRIYGPGGNTPSPESKLSKINVLVLDGGAKAAELIKAIFAELGLKNVFVANDGYQGVQVLKEVKIHIIFTDSELKVMKHHASNKSVDQPGEIAPVSGIHMVQRLRRSSISPSPFVPIIMMMDTVDKKSVLEARDAGVNEILLRPVDAEEFCQRLISIIDHPRMFVTADTYKGPCRRRANGHAPAGTKERRVREVRIVKSQTR